MLQRGKRAPAQHFTCCCCYSVALALVLTQDNLEALLDAVHEGEAKLKAGRVLKVARKWRKLVSALSKRAALREEYGH